MAGSLVRQSDWVENLSNSFPVNAGATIAWMGAFILSPFKCNRVAKRYPLIHRITNKPATQVRFVILFRTQINFVALEDCASASHIYCAVWNGEAGQKSGRRIVARAVGRRAREIQDQDACSCTLSLGASRCPAKHLRSRIVLLLEGEGIKRGRPRRCGSWGGKGACLALPENGAGFLPQLSWGYPPEKRTGRRCEPAFGAFIFQRTSDAGLPQGLDASAGCSHKWQSFNPF